MTDWINKAIVGDNLEVMKQLPSNYIDLIYCDILYGTGRDFGDYKDLRAKRKEIENFYIPRIKEMYRLLKDTGSIYLQMDTRINHWMRCIMDDIFGYNRFVNEICVKKRSNAQNTPVSFYRRNHDVILFYTKSKDYTFNKQYRPISQNTIDKYKYTDENGRNYYFCNLVDVGYNAVKTLVFEGKEYTGAYAWKQETLDKRIAEGVKIKVNSKGNLVYANYLDSKKGVQYSDIWTHTTYETEQRIYKTEKPIKLLDFIIKASSNKGDIVADFFCGSGTTLEVANELGRNFFGCDINPRAIQITNSRIRPSLFSAV